MAFSAGDAAVEGFRIVRQRPKAVGLWLLAAIVFGLLTSMGTVLLFGGTMSELTGHRGNPADPAETMALMGRMGALYAVMLPVAIVYLSVFLCAVYRAVLKPDDSRFGYLRLGADELRMAVVQLALFALFFVVVFAVAMLMAVVIGGAAFASMNGGGQPSAGGVAGMVFGVLAAYVLMIGILLAFWVKLSFAGPMTLDRKRIVIFGSWNATKGRFWSLFGCYLLSVVLSIVVTLLGWAVTMAVLMAFGASVDGGPMGMLRALEADMTSITSYLSPVMIAYTVVNTAFSVLAYTIMLAPPAAAYRDIVGVRRPEVASTFN